MTANPYAAREKFKPRVQAVDIAGRVPPHNEDAELAVLSAELLSAAAVDEVLPILPTGEPFYADAHRRIHDAVVAIHATGQPVDITTVAGFLKDRDRLQAIGGVSYLTKIVDSTPSVAHVSAHANIVREKWRVRRAIEAQQMGAAEAYGDYGQAEEYLVRVVESLANIADDKIDSQEGALVYDLMRSVIVDYETGAMKGTPSGFVDIDKKTGGMRDGELIIVAARPGAGKTSYAMNVATAVASLPEPKTPDDPAQCGVMVFSLEMPKGQLASRMACSEGRVSLSAYRQQTVAADGWDRLVVAADRLSQLPMWIDDAAAATLLEIRAKVRKRQHAFDKRWPDTDKWKRRIGLIVIDYLQLMRHPSAEKREQEVAAISQGLKNIAKSLSVPVLALAQLNRNVENRGSNKRPQLSDLRESGAIEMDADMVQFLYRPEMYMAPEDLASDKGARYRGYAEVIIAKQRNGPTGNVPVTFIDEFTRFENRSKESWSDTE